VGEQRHWDRDQPRSEVAGFRHDHGLWLIGVGNVIQTLDQQKQNEPPRDRAEVRVQMFTGVPARSIQSGAMHHGRAYRMPPLRM